MSSSKNDKIVFWGCFISLITTAFAFISRAFLVNDPSLWPAQFGLDKVQGQELFGAGIWPFAISIILFSLIIDKIGYRVAMFFSFACYLGYAAFALLAYATVSGEVLEGAALVAAQAKAVNYLTIGSIILGLGNGTVEAFINPVVATLFSKDKTKWLNILHAGWPGGLVIGGILTILLGKQVAADWRVLVYFIAIPAVIYVVMLAKAKFPVNERVEAGASYREMLGEFGAAGAALASFLVFKQLGLVFGFSNVVVFVLVALTTAGYFYYCRSFGRPVIVFLCVVMMPLGITELGTDGAITGIMEEPLKQAGRHPLLVLIYTSAIMTVLRFNAGPVVNKLTPLGLLAACAALAVLGLFLLSFAQGLFFVFAAATLYGVAKTYFWPTMLGVVSEQSPKGGALTLNAISGIGMLTVGIIGAPLIGKMQEDSAVAALKAEKSALVSTITSEDKYFLGDYTKVDDKKVAALSEVDAKEVGEVVTQAKQGALAKVTVFPLFMLICYLGLIFYFKSKGGYKAVSIAGDGAH